jgi:sugar O-acyltransferase (sialic acid O-acetyltransferase NeuD family)
MILMDKIVIFGNSQVACMNHFYLTHDASFTVTAFTVDGEYIEEDSLLGLPIIPFSEIESARPPDDHKMAVPLGFRKVNRFRAEKYSQAKAKGYQLISYVSAKAITWRDLVLGENCFVYEGAIIQPYAKIGNNVIIAPGSIVGHHSVVRDHCFLASHTVILGNVKVGQYSVLGANSTVRDQVTIASECIIGAGTLITKDTHEKGVYIGRPAELVPKPSNELSALLTWSVEAGKS